MYHPHADQVNPDLPSKPPPPPPPPPAPGAQEAHIQGAVVCPTCDSVYRVEDRRLACKNCGHSLVLAEEEGLAKPRRYAGAFAFMKPLADASEAQWKSSGLLFETGGPSLREQVEGRVSCGWCGTHFDHRPDSPNCTNCGGVLPLPPGIELGDPPPDPNRRLPVRFLLRLYVKQNIAAWVGLGMVLLSIPLVFLLGPLTLLLTLVGLFVAGNFLVAFNRHRGLRSGVSTPGKIESVRRYGDAKKGIPIFQVYFRFEARGEPVRGMKFSYDRSVTNHFVGQPVWIVYLPKKTACYDIWPPLA